MLFNKIKEIFHLVEVVLEIHLQMSKIEANPLGQYKILREHVAMNHLMVGRFKLLQEAMSHYLNFL